METREEKLLRLWKARQEAEGHDVSRVNTLVEAEHFFDRPAAGEAAELPEVPEVPDAPEVPETDAEDE